MTLPSVRWRSKRSASLLAAAVALLVMALPGPSSGQSQQAQRGTIQDDFSLMLMVHTTFPPDAGTGPPMPWDGESDGTYRYNSINCTGNAPVNNIGTNLTTYNSRLPGSKSPASIRAHPFEFIATHGNSAPEVNLNGRLVLTVCQRRGGPGPPVPPDATKEKIFFDFTATAEKESPEEVHFDGAFRIVGGTGVYKDITGSGRIHGYLFCFNHLDEAPPGLFCGGIRYTDGQMTMTGHYNDPTVAELGIGPNP